MVNSAAALPPTADGRFSTADGLSLYERAWTPRAAARSAVVIVHGYAEHSGRYAALARSLLERGHAVYAYDQRGYGRSEGRRAYVPAFDRYVDDLRGFVARVHGFEPDAPLFVLGHSMGGTAAALLSLAPPSAVAGVILSSPALRIGVDVPDAVRYGAGLLARVLPTLPTIRLDRTRFSHDPAVVAEIERDPLYYHGRMPARTGAELIDATRRFWPDMDRVTLPLMIVHGTGDEIADVTGSCELYRRAASADKTLALFEGLYHETFREPTGAFVLDEIGDWLDEHT